VDRGGDPEAAGEVGLELPPAQEAGREGSGVDLAAGELEEELPVGGAPRGRGRRAGAPPPRGGLANPCGLGKKGTARHFSWSAESHTPRDRRFGDPRRSGEAPSGLARRGGEGLCGMRGANAVGDVLFGLDDQGRVQRLDFRHHVYSNLLHVLPSLKAAARQPHYKSNSS
jgi:hypothetical protein